MRKKSNRHSTDESCIKEKRTKIEKNEGAESDSNEKEEPETLKKIKKSHVDNKLVTGNSKKAAKEKKAKLNSLDMKVLNVDGEKEHVNGKVVKMTEASNKSAFSNNEKVVKEKKSSKKEQTETTYDIKEPAKGKKHKKSKTVFNSVISGVDVGNVKKIISMPQEVPAKSGATNKKFLNEDEAQVKDEDIDKFCDELDEEDNAQFDDWVKLIEAKLHSNIKKKSV